MHTFRRIILHTIKAILNLSAQGKCSCFIYRYEHLKYAVFLDATLYASISQEKENFFYENSKKSCSFFCCDASINPFSDQGAMFDNSTVTKSYTGNNSDVMLQVFAWRSKWDDEHGS